MKPSKAMQFGTIFSTYFDAKLIANAKKLLFQRYNISRLHHEHEGERSWCKFYEPELIINDPDGKSLNDPLNMRTTVAIKWSVTGRAYYMHRNFRAPRVIKRHPNTKNVPKRKRGKPILRK